MATSSQPTRSGSGSSARSQINGDAQSAAQPPALWKLLDAVAQCLQAVRAGQSTTTLFEKLDRAIRPGVQALLFQTLRNLGRAQALRSALAPRTPPARVDNLLCTALALAWQDGEAPYPSFTLVSQAVEAAKRNPLTRGQAGFINACLRRFLRERDTLVSATDADPVAYWNHPLWWIERVQRDYPDRWQDILRANNAHAPMTLRVNLQRGSAEDYVQRLRSVGLDGHQISACGIELLRPAPVTQLPGFANGAVSVQDAAAQLAAPLLLAGLPVAQSLEILDACAAPGGKTAHMLEMAGEGTHWRVTALEMDADRARRIGETLTRLQLQANVLVADAGDTAKWWKKANDGMPFDAILLDAPCSASGIVRRHPDVRWLRRESDIAQLARQQDRLLEALWPLLKPGGRMLYCTCSIFREEGENRIQAFVSRNSGAQLLPSPGHLMPGQSQGRAAVRENASGDHDGFYYALLQKQAA